MPTGFWKDESGAITVDWTVLTGGLVAVGIAVAAVVAAGVENVSEEVSETVADVIEAVEQGLIYFGDFTDGAAGWLNGSVSDDSDFGPVLGPFAGSGGEVATEASFDIPSGAETASFTFDMLAIDSWDNEEFIVFVDGQPAASLQFQWGTDGTTGEWVSSNPDHSFEVVGVSQRAHSGYNSGWTDQVASVRLDVANPGGTVTLGFGSTLDQSREDESFAIDNVALSLTPE